MPPTESPEPPESCRNCNVRHTGICAVLTAAELHHLAMVLGVRSDCLENDGYKLTHC